MKEKIKNLYNKKPIKIIFRIITVLTYLFTIIMILLLSLGSCNYDHKDNNVKNLATTPIKRELDYNGERYLFSVEDIINSYTWNNYYAKNPQGFNNIETLQSILIVADSSPWADFGGWNQVNWDTLGMSGSTFRFNSVQFITTGNDSHFIHYQMRLVNSVNSEYRIITTFTYVRPYNSDGGDFSGTLINIHNSLEADYCISLNRYDSPGLYDLFTFSSSGSYQEGYVAGYNSGSNSGYRNGYTDGYNAGSVDHTQNAFVLIREGFEAVAGLLDIQILPHLPLWVLMFTPVILSIVIVVVKMIKG